MEEDNPMFRRTVSKAMADDDVGEASPTGRSRRRFNEHERLEQWRTAKQLRRLSQVLGLSSSPPPPPPTEQDQWSPRQPGSVRRSLVFVGEAMEVVARTARSGRTEDPAQEASRVSNRASLPIGDVGQNGHGLAEQLRSIVTL